MHANNPAEVPARLEALGALCGLDCAALHSQHAAAVQVVLHVGRELGGRHRLSEIAVLRLVARVRHRLPVVPCAAAIALALALVVPANIVVALAIAGTVALRRRRRLGQQRREAESAALQGALEVLVGELRVGVHPVAAFGVAANEVDATVATSLQAVAARARLGADVAGGLRSVAERSGCPRAGSGSRCVGSSPQTHGLAIASLMTAQRNIVERELFSTRVGQKPKHAARLEQMPRYRLRIQQLTLIIRSPLHTTIIPNNQHQPQTATPDYSGHSYSG